jgi:hypothetical protein
MVEGRSTKEVTASEQERGKERKMVKLIFIKNPLPK